MGQLRLLGTDNDLSKADSQTKPTFRLARHPIQRQSGDLLARREICGLALNAQQVAGIKAQRELPVVWAVAKGSFVNKLILVPLALAISAFAPWAVMPLLMAGGAFLCFEGFEKLAHKYLQGRTGDATQWADNQGQVIEAQAIQALDALDETRAPTSLLAIPSSDYPTPARRPLNSRLDNAKLEQTFGLRLQDWRSALALCMTEK